MQVILWAPFRHILYFVDRAAS